MALGPKQLLLIFWNILIVSKFSVFSRELKYVICKSETNIASDFMPLFQLSKSHEVIVPSINTETGEWSLRTPYRDDAQFTATCSGEGNSLKYFGRDSISARCDIHGNIQTEYGEIKLEELICSRATTQSIVENGTCPWNDAMRITITPANSGSYPYSADEQIHCCFDPSKSSTYNVRHYVDGKNLYQSETVSRPSFKDAGFYPRIDIDECFTKAVQAETFEKILGSPDSKVICTNPNDYSYYLARGHLCAMADMWRADGKLATFYFPNVVPQWQIMNAGNWLNVENDLRNWAMGHGHVLEVTTGPHEVLTMKDVYGVSRELWLGRDKSTGDLLNECPVPKRMIKIVFCEATGSGIAIIQEHNPCGTYSVEDHICKDITDEISWVTWDTKDVAKGYTYFCDLSTFCIENYPCYPTATLIK